MEIIHISAELAPIAKVGGLADVLHGLSRALINKGHHVQIILPKYDTLNLNQINGLKLIDFLLPLSFEGNIYKNKLWKGEVDGITVVLIESQDPKGYFNRGKIYGCEDDASRFLYFCLVALEYVSKYPCDVIHLHDWHTAAIAGLIKQRYPEIKAKTVLTIHNFAYQGHCSQEDLKKAEWVDEALLDGDNYNLLKGGIVYADQVTTVSPNYAHELLTTSLGGTLQATLKKYVHKFQGVLNGIDDLYWNPETDPHLPIHYSLKTLSQKKKIKHLLKEKFSLLDTEAPLVCAITRLVHQKGPDLIKSALLKTLEWGGQFILIGSALDEKTNLRFYNLQRALAPSPYVHLELTYHEELAHLVFAGSDLFVIPSLFEPCGLTQLIAMRYGTIPLARETGGLMDTVFEGKNGFTFGPPTAESLNVALDRALEMWHQEPEKWQEIQKNGMEQNFSWEKPAESYLKIYSLPAPIG